MNTILASIIPSLAWSLLDFVWQGLLVSLCVALLFALLRTARPQIRYAIGCAALLLCVALPLAGTVGRVIDAQSGVTTMLPLARAGAFDATGDKGIHHNLNHGFNYATVAPLVMHLATWEQRLQPQLPLVMLFWCCGAGVLALRMALGLAWVRRRSQPGQYHVNPLWQARAEHLAARFAVGRKVTVGIVSDLTGPVTAGCLRPLILLPASLLTGMPPDLIEALLAHEMAHIKRHDYLVNLFQSAIEIVLFYHPAVWWLSSRIRIEREQIADDLAASTLGEPRRLALALAELDQFQFSPPQLAQAAHAGDLMQRITRLVRPESATLNWKMALPILGLVGACAALYANAAPEPVKKKLPEWSVTRGEGGMAYALVRSKDRRGSVLNGSSDDWKDIEVVKAQMPGEFLWFRKGGTAMVIRDSTVLAQVANAYAPLDQLTVQMDGYSTQMDVHSKAMDKLAAELDRTVRAASPDAASQRAQEQISKSREREMAQLGHEMDRLGRKLGVDSASNEAISLQMRDVSHRMVALSARMFKEHTAVKREHDQGAAQRAAIDALSTQMAKMGKPMEALGKQMEGLGKQMEEKSRLANRQVHTLIDGAIARGLAQRVPTSS